jgi:S1-C subfamily serine protease
MNWYWFRRAITHTTCLFICVGGISLALPRQESNKSDCTTSECLQPVISPSSTPLSVERSQQLAKSITVKISAKELLGSGTLLRRQGQIYTVITNAHVLRAAKPPYEIQTPDGRVYQASVLQVAEFQKDDLAVLQFPSPDIVYPVATVKDTSSLRVGDEVFVGGFTSNVTTQKLNNQAEKAVKNSFVFTSGKISLLLDKALEGGYQIGYTNDVRKGMSGAPLLNIHGEVVGINSLHKDPLWDTPEVYQDGEQPEQHLQELITRSSMAVPINKEMLQKHREDKL